MNIIMATGNGSGPVSVTLTFGGSTPTTAPPATTPGTDITHGGTTVPSTHLPFTGMPAVAELDIALVLAVLGATIVTTVSRLTKRAAAPRGVGLEG